MRSTLSGVAFTKALKEKERVLLIVQMLGAAVPNAVKIYGRLNPGGCYCDFVTVETECGLFLMFAALLLVGENLELCDCQTVALFLSKESDAQIVTCDQKLHLKNSRFCLDHCSM